MKNIGFFAITPAQIYFFKNIIQDLNSRGYNTYLLVRDYGETLSLVDELQLPHYIFSRSPDSKHGKILNLPRDILTAYNYLKDKTIDIVMGFGFYESFTSAFLKVPAITFTDSEYSVNRISFLIQFYLTSLFTEIYITPTSYRQNLGKKQIRVNSYKELAYLHTNYYTPNKDIYKILGLNEGKPYVIVRFNNFDAVHDFGINGFEYADKIRLVRELEQYATVLISSEAIVPEELKNHLMNIPKSCIHDAIYYANLLVTDTQTMATEGALLGTPTIRCNSFVGENDMGNFIELENKYLLLFNFKDPSDAIKKAIELVKNKSLKNDWQNKRKVVLKDKIDITQLIVWLLATYPDSIKTLKSLS